MAVQSDQNKNNVPQLRSQASRCEESSYYDLSDVFKQ